MLVCWMPYLTLAYPKRGPQEHRIGKAIFFPDTATNWPSIVGCPRPQHLEIHKDFPRLSSSDQFGAPLFGTLVRSDDEQWLMDHLDEAVAVLHFIGAEFRPAECFAYHRLRITDTTTDDNLVSYATKHGELWESSGSLTLLPPLAVRGKQSTYHLDLEQEESIRLLARMTADPHDRMVVAVRQYFRTQFADTFTSPLAEDYALHCGAIEAALNIDALSPGVGDRFAEGLVNIYGNELYFREFFYGLYVSRSLFVHGVSVSHASAAATKAATAYQVFRNAHCKISLMRVLTKDVICHELGRAPDPFHLLSGDSALPLLRTVLHSGDYWSQAKSLFTRGKAADRLLAMPDEAFKEVEELAYRLDDYFNWQCVQEPVEQRHVCKAICTCALMIGRLTESTGNVYQQSDRLGRAAHAGDSEAIESWIIEDPWHTVGLQEGDRLATIQRISRTLAKYCDRHHIVS